ncbi:MAG: DNA alkylation repair protein [Planctomycetes bacterium]|nr:DNA alkylation repair protein [Planctomycetota bacterium]
MQLKEIIQRFEDLSNPETVAGMERYGIKSEKIYGVSIPEIRKLAKEIGTDRKLAHQLWKVNCRERRILAGMIDQPAEVPETQLDQWVTGFDNWEVCDQCCMNLFEKTPFAYKKAKQWSKAKEEFIRRAGFVMMARLAVSDKKAADQKFEAFLPLIVKRADDERNYVKKAVSWALRQIGKRNRHLNQKAIAAARQIQKTDTKATRWIASDVLRELTDQKTQKRLKH